MTTKTILVVEDNELNRLMLVEILSDSYTVLEACNGLEALKLLEERDDEVDLILLDVMMPVLDGFAFLDHVKRDPRLSLIPVIVTTQNDQESDEIAALSHGATDFVPKPYRPQVILHRVASLIKLRETAAMINQLRYDRLTGLLSREYFYARVRETLQENPRQAYIILCANVVHFNLFNDHYGTAAGDRLLQGLAGLVKERFSDRGIYGRATADRFLALLPRRAFTNEELAALSSEMLRLSGAPRNMVVKFGLYEITDRSVEVAQMCDRALLAADSIKGQYDRFLAVYDDALRGKLLREQSITNAMEEALAQGQFTVFLQPKYRIRDERLAGAEALVRWDHPQWGPLSPGEFIPLFEKNGFITKLDQYIWERVGGILASWRDRGLPWIPISVNVSREDIDRCNLARTLLDILEKYHLPPEWIHLEITESAYTENPEQIISTVTELRQLGFVIEMDDFGSGYSSLNMLNQMPLDVLKLDMQFVRNETAKPVEQSILRFIVGLARWMELEVVAEGVETQEQLRRLRELGCDYAQGFLLGRPMPVPELEARLTVPEPEAPVPQTAPERNGSVRSLLVVDENPGIRALVEEHLTGYRVFTARDLREAIPIIDGHSGALSAVVVSMTLPEQGASKVVRTLRQNPLTWHIPVLATAPNGVDMEHEAMALGADEFSFRPRDQVCLHCLGKRIAGLETISTFRKRERVLKDEASRDFLTELLNRRGLDSAIAGLRREDYPLAVCLFDLDDLKRINDSEGHFEGDRALREFARLLRGHTRGQDILCRYGGDEFAMLLRRVTSPEAIVRKVSAICENFSETTHFACSCGMVVADKWEQPVSELLRKADQALFRAKRETRGSCVLWEK